MYTTKRPGNAFKTFMLTDISHRLLSRKKRSSGKLLRNKTKKKDDLIWVSFQLPFCKFTRKCLAGAFVRFLFCRSFAYNAPHVTIRRPSLFVCFVFFLYLLFLSYCHCVIPLSPTSFHLFSSIGMLNVANPKAANKMAENHVEKYSLRYLWKAGFSFSMTEFYLKLKK